MMSSNTLVITPISKGEILAPFSLGLPRLVCSVDVGWLPREHRINMARSLCQKTFKSGYLKDYEWVLLMDSDVVVDKVCFEKLKQSACQGKTACADTKCVKTGHVVCSCAMLRVDDYIKVDYLDKPNVCQCLKLPNPFYVEGAVGYERK